MRCISRSTILLVSVAAAWGGDCILVDGARIRAADLATAIPAFAALAPETDFGPSPAGTMARVYTKLQLAAMLGVSASDGLPSRLCVERRREPIDDAIWQSAIEDVLAKNCPEGRWRAKVMEAPRHRFPSGTLGFLPIGLMPSRTGTQTWRGAIHLADKSSVPVWVRVELAIRRHVLVVTRDIALGSPVGESDYKWDDVWAPPQPGASLCAADEAEWRPDGMIAKRALQAGSNLAKNDLRRAPAIQRGEAVEVEAQAGHARIRIPAVASRDAHVGESVPVTSSWNGSKLTARVTGERKAKVD